MSNEMLVNVEDPKTIFVDGTAASVIEDLQAEFQRRSGNA